MTGVGLFSFLRRLCPSGVLQRPGASYGRRSWPERKGPSRQVVSFNRNGSRYLRDGVRLEKEKGRRDSQEQGLAAVPRQSPGGVSPATSLGQGHLSGGEREDTCTTSLVFQNCFQPFSFSLRRTRQFWEKPLMSDWKGKPAAELRREFIRKFMLARRFRWTLYN